MLTAKSSGATRRTSNTTASYDFLQWPGRDLVFGPSSESWLPFAAGS